MENELYWGESHLVEEVLTWDEAECFNLGLLSRQLYDAIVIDLDEEDE